MNHGWPFLHLTITLVNGKHSSLEAYNNDDGKEERILSD